MAPTSSGAASDRPGREVPGAVEAVAASCEVCDVSLALLYRAYFVRRGERHVPGAYFVRRGERPPGPGGPGRS